MLKLIIADDERIIRETISTIIDWQNYNIEVVGLCKNGLETYDMIMDENPDIVLTDIRMPGMDGLELIHRVSQINPSVQFIILSGYGEFEYAKQAMKHGVKHYLLKPSNESQILDCIRQCQKDYRKYKDMERVLLENTNSLNSMMHNVIFSIINDSICKNHSLKKIQKTYDSYLDFTFIPYRLFYVYFLTFENLESFLESAHTFCSKNMKSVVIHGIYVNNTLLLFFRDCMPSYSALEQFILDQTYATTLETKEVSYSNLSELLSEQLPKLQRFSMIYYINNFHLLYTCNYNKQVQELDSIFKFILSRDSTSISKLEEFVSGISDITFFRQLAGNLFIKLSLENIPFSSQDLTNCLKEIENEDNLVILKRFVINQIQTIIQEPATHTLNTTTQQICDYVENNLQNDCLTLKYISENVLFMNVDYVSRKFQKEKGVKFSTYLSDQRIQKAQELMRSGRLDTIQEIAEAIGFGNNPNYFSQLFKKKTGISPSVYMTELLKR